MFIAHIPSGYLLARQLEKHLQHGSPIYVVMIACLVGSVAPDLDMIYFYLIDNRQTNHHLYWTHLPIFWSVVLPPISVLLTVVGKENSSRVMLVLYAAIMLHLILDTISGGIAWYSPFDDTMYRLIDIRAQYSWWVWNFIFHWTFIAELVICVLAAVWLKGRRSVRLGDSIKEHA